MSDTFGICDFFCLTYDPTGKLYEDGQQQDIRKSPFILTHV